MASVGENRKIYELCKKIQLKCAFSLFEDSSLTRRTWRCPLKKSNQKRQSQVVALFVVNKSCVGSPVDPCNWSRSKTRIGNGSFVNKRDSVPSSNHPLNISGGRGQTS